MGNVYHRLCITATEPTTKIWIGDDEGFLVVAEVGVVDERLRPGNYVVSFTPQMYLTTPIRLDRDLTITEEELKP